MSRPTQRRDGVVRSIRQPVAFSLVEYGQLKREAYENNMSVSELIRWRCLTRKVERRSEPPLLNEQLYRDLNSLGIDVNQVTHKVNAAVNVDIDPGIYIDKVKQLSSKLDSLLSQIHKTLETANSRGEYHEHLDSDEYVELAHRWLKGMEFLGEELSCSQYLIARHHDTLHEHIHIIASRIRMDGSVVSDSWDYRRSEVIVRQLEKEFNLEATPCSNERVALKATEQGIETTVSDRRAPTSKQKHHHAKPLIRSSREPIFNSGSVAFSSNCSNH